MELSEDEDGVEDDEEKANVEGYDVAPDDLQVRGLLIFRALCNRSIKPRTTWLSSISRFFQAGSGCKVLCTLPSSLLIEVAV